MTDQIWEGALPILSLWLQASIEQKGGLFQITEFTHNRILHFFCMCVSVCVRVCACTP